MDIAGRRASRAAVRLACALALGTAAGSGAAQQTPPDRTANRDWTTAAPSYFDPLDLTWNDGRWWITGFGGVVVKNYLSQAVRLDPDLGRNYTIGAALGREFGRWEPWFRFEWEVSASLQFGREWSGDFRIMPMARFVNFPWNEYLHTTAAVGWGLSWMTRKSRYEEQPRDIPTHRLNSGMAFELTVADPVQPAWAAIFRIQHRSGLLGYWKDHGDDLDYVIVGLKHRF